MHQMSSFWKLLQDKCFPHYYIFFNLIPLSNDHNLLGSYINVKVLLFCLCLFITVWKFISLSYEQTNGRIEHQGKACKKFDNKNCFLTIKDASYWNSILKEYYMLQTCLPHRTIRSLLKSKCESYGTAFKVICHFSASEHAAKKTNNYSFCTVQ